MEPRGTALSLPPTFERAATAWLEAEKPHLAERTYEIYDVAIRCHLTPALGPRLLCDIGADAIASYQARRKTASASARTVNKELQVLRQILKRHKLWGNLQGDVKFEREHSDIGKALTREEEKLLLGACGANPLLNAVVTRLNREVGEIDVDRQPRHVADEQIDGRPAFQCEAGFLRDGRENTDQQLDLSSIDLTEGQRDPPER